MATKPKVVTLSGKKYTPVWGAYVAPEINGVRDFYICVPIDVFLRDFPENENQRDSELRETSHLVIVMPEHRTVSILQGFDGRIAIVDGHTRAMVYRRDPANRPTHIHVHVFDITDDTVDFEEQEQRLYDSADSRRAVKSAAHTVQGALSKKGIVLKTKWLKAGGFSEAVKAASLFNEKAPSFNKSNISNLVGFFGDELIAFDGLAPTKGPFVVPFIASAILMLRLDASDKTLTMLQAYGNRAGAMSIGDMHSPHALLKQYRDAGVDGGGALNKCKGKFPTSNGDSEKAISTIFPLMLLARDNPTGLFGVRDAEVLPMSRKKIQKLFV